MQPIDYWKECLSEAACESGLALSDEHLSALAEAAETGHECYKMAFYSPPASDRIAEVEREWKRKYEALERQFEAYRDNAETAVKVALKQYPDSNVRIGEHGEVTRVDGRTTRIQ